MKLRQAIQMLNEQINVNKIVGQMGQKLAMRYKQELNKDVDPRVLVDEIVNDIVGNKVDDSTGNGFVRWIIFMYISGSIRRWEDISKLKETVTEDEEGNELNAIETFVKHKAKLKDYPRDILQYKTYGEFFDAMDTLKGAQTGSQEDAAIMKQAKIWLDTPEYRVVSPLTKEASCHFGTNTRWCTAGKKDNKFATYHSDNNPLYVILHKPANRRWQFSWSHEQFMDEKDEPVNLYKFFKEHPKLLKIPDFGEFFQFTDEGYRLMVPAD